jgi:hypothetical protein
VSVFNDVDDDMQDALDDAFGEGIRIIPQGERGWRGQGGIDPNRPVRDIQGRYRSTPTTSEMEGNREGSRFQSMSRISTRSHALRISPAEITALGYAPIAGDTVTLTTRIDQPTFTVTSVGLRDSGETQLELVSGAVA